MKKLCYMVLLSLLYSCDKVKEDVLPEVSIQPVIYTESGGKAIISLFGAFENEGLQISSNSDQTTQIGDLPYLIFDAGAGPVADQVIDLEISKGQAVVGNATVEIKTIRDSDCVNSAFSDDFVIQASDSLGVDLLDNDAFCDFVDPGTRAIREIPISNFDSVKLSVAPEEAVLSYVPPPGFTGTVQFIYEICFGFDPDLGPELLENPIENCEYYYTALVTIEVI